MNKATKLKIFAALTVGLLGGFFAVSTNMSARQDAADISARIMECADIQGQEVEINEAAVVCAMDTMRASLKAGTYTQIYEVVPQMRQTNLRIACHQAAHRLGVELLKSVKPQEMVDMMFKSEPRPVDDVCTHSLIHGLIQGMTEEENSYELRQIADQCMYLKSVHEYYYIDECAHYYGHAVWKKVKSFNEDIGLYCKYLYEDGDPRHVIACMGGVIMQKYDLQLYTPMSDNPGVMLTPPSYEEIELICDAYRNSDKLIQDGCMSGIGWLAPTTALSRLHGLDLDGQVVEYKRALATCNTNPECERTFILHFRVDAYKSGVAARVCNETKMTLPDCPMVVAKFTGGA